MAAEAPMDRELLAKNWWAFALIGLTGWVDAVGYLALGPLFVSFMSGNSTQLGVGLGRGQWHAAARAGGIIALYVLGAFAGTLGAGAAGKWRLPAVLGFEASLLGSVLLLPASAGEFPAAAFPTVLAMGLQNTVLGRVGSRRVSLTYVTGTLVRLGQELAEAVTGRGERWAWSGDALLWLSMVAGATGGAASFAWLGLRSLALPATAALVLAVAGGGRTGSGIP